MHENRAHCLRIRTHTALPMARWQRIEWSDDSARPTERLNSWSVAHMGSFDYIGHYSVYGWHRSIVPLCDAKKCALCSLAEQIFQHLGNWARPAVHGLSDRKVMPGCVCGVCVCVRECECVWVWHIHPSTSASTSLPHAICVNIDIMVVADPKHT